MRTVKPLARPVLAVLAALVLLSCDNSMTEPSGQALAAVGITASVSGTPVATLVIEVTAPNIQPALVFNLTVEDGFASGTLRLPPGSDRRIAARALDAEGVTTHEGSVIVDIHPGQNPPVSIPMVPQGGHQPITIQIGDVSITIQPGDLTVVVGFSDELTATIRAANGDLLDEAAVWATSDPSVATVSDGLVTGVRKGEANIVATFAGIAAAAQITVIDPFVALDQPPAPGTTQGLYSDDACGASGCVGTTEQSVAENLTLSRSATIKGIEIWGGYFPNNDPLAQDAFTVILHVDDNGLPGASVHTEDIAPQRVATGSSFGSVTEYLYVLEFQSPPELDAGSYWVEIFNNTAGNESNFTWERGTLDASAGISGSVFSATAPGVVWDHPSSMDLAIRIEAQ